MNLPRWPSWTSFVQQTTAVLAILLTVVRSCVCACHLFSISQMFCLFITVWSYFLWRARKSHLFVSMWNNDISCIRNPSQRLPKVQILRAAIQRIEQLQRMLYTDEQLKSLQNRVDGVPKSKSSSHSKVNSIYHRILPTWLFSDCKIFQSYFNWVRSGKSKRTCQEVRKPTVAMCFFCTCSSNTVYDR